MTTNKELLAPKEITRVELRQLVDEWVAAGNKITMCPPGVALNFRTAEVPKVRRPKTMKKPAPKTKPVAIPTKKKKKK